jgi:hypothetical protein
MSSSSSGFSLVGRLFSLFAILAFFALLYCLTGIESEGCRHFPHFLVDLQQSSEITGVSQQLFDSDFVVDLVGLLCCYL